MLKTRDFYLMKVYDIRGKYLGVVDDISIDFYGSKVKGFIISSISFWKKRNYVEVEDVISIEECMIVKGVKLFSGLAFKEIKYMDIINKHNVMIGVLEDLIIEKSTFYIKGLIISSGIFDRIIKGKEILIVKSCILCEKYILYIGSEGIKVKTLPHSLGGIKKC